jgi:hypothetical protein
VIPARARVYLQLQKKNGLTAALETTNYPLVTIFEPGTTTPLTQTIYRSATGDNTYDNPFSGTVDGVVEFFLERPQRVNIQATADGLGTVVLDYEPALGDPSDTAFRGPSPWADVTAYGAVGDGIADDTAALNTAYTEAKAAHAPLFFPNLEYRITAPLDWLASGMQIFGLGGGIDPVNGVYGARLVTSAALSFMLRLSGEHFGLSGLMLNGGGAAVHGLELGDAYYFDVERVLATGNQTGIYSSGNQYSGRFMGARGFKNSLIGLHIKKPSSGGSATQKMDLFGVACEGNAQHGLIIEGGEEVNVWGGAYQGYGVGYPTQRGIRLVGNAANCVIVGPHIESNTIAGISMEKWLSTDGPYSAETCKVIGATIFAGTGGKAIIANGAYECEFDANTFKNSSAASLIDFPAASGGAQNTRNVFHASNKFPNTTSNPIFGGTTGLIIGDPMHTRVSYPATALVESAQMGQYLQSDVALKRVRFSASPSLGNVGTGAVWLVVIGARNAGGDGANPSQVALAVVWWRKNYTTVVVSGGSVIAGESAGITFPNSNTTTQFQQDVVLGTVTRDSQMVAVHQLSPATSGLQVPVTISTLDS